jgi:hypothetical protein
MRSLIGAMLGVFCLVAPAAAETPVAIVEDVQGKVDGIEFMDYVVPGKVIKLGPKATIVLGYLKSCWRETITGGIVLVGPEQSSVQLGDMQRVKVPCDAKTVQISDREANQSAATTFRTLKSDQRAAVAKLPTIYGTSPLVEAKGGGTLVIERIDATEDKLNVPLNSSLQVRGRFYDLFKTGKTLTPGGTYLATLKSRRVTFVVDPQSTSAPTPIVGRLLRLE